MTNKNHKTIGYLRVSSIDQDIDKNKADIFDLVNEKKLGKVDFVEEKVSGRISWKKRKIADLMEELGNNDNLVLSELSRLGRSMLECMEILSIASQKGINIYAVKGNWQLDHSIQSKIIAMAFSMAAEIERDLISQRTKEALRIKKAQGIKLGRPKGPGKSKLDKYRPEIEALLSNGSTQKFIANRYGTTEANLHNWMKKHGLKKTRSTAPTKKIKQKSESTVDAEKAFDKQPVINPVAEVPREYRGKVVLNFIREARRFYHDTAIVSAIRYTAGIEHWDSPERFVDMVENVLRDSLYLGQDQSMLPDPLADTHAPDVQEKAEVGPLEFDDSVAADPEPIDEPAAGRALKIPESDISGKPDPTAEGTTEQKKDSDSQEIIENDLDLFTGDPIPKPELPDCHSKKLSTEERYRYLCRTEEMFPGEEKNEARADALNKKGVFTARGNRWTGKSLAAALIRAKKKL